MSPTRGSAHAWAHGHEREGTSQELRWADSRAVLADVRRRLHALGGRRADGRRRARWAPRQGARRRRPPYGSALDLGCGSRRWSIELARRGWQVVGVDVVAKAVRRARRRAQDEGVDVTFVEGDVTAAARRRHRHRVLVRPRHHSPSDLENQNPGHCGALSKVTTADMAQVQEQGTAFHPIGITYDRGTGRMWVTSAGDRDLRRGVAGVICPGVTAEPAGRGC
jgi:SAM-dependent methyltransferase